MLPHDIWLGLPFLLIPHRQEPIRFAPAIRLIPEFALPIGVGPRRLLPLCRLQKLHLKLESRRGLGHFLVIDNIERPPES